jgi:hypothetical protein
MVLDVAPHVSDLQRQIATLERRLKAADDGAGRPPRNRVREALLRFRTQGDFTDARDARVICFAAGERQGEDGYRLIEDDCRFPNLLQQVDHYKPKPRIFRRCYRGLLASYFSYDGGGDGTPPAGRRNWQSVRTYLHDRFAAIRVPGVEPDWVAALEEHRNLLTASPADRYGLQRLRGDRDEFEDVCRRLSLDGSSWLVPAVVLAQVQAATAERDAAFVGHLPALFDVLQKHRTLIDRGLALLLMRYHRFANPEVHVGLRDFAVGTWGNPWLTMNSARWGRVDEACRRMVAGWLKHDLMRQFFEVLSQDGANDQRRLRFWEGYLDSISDMYFALGSAARKDARPDYRSLRKKMQGRMLELNPSGSPNNNAFIMKIGTYMIIEFGITGNACFIFHGDRVPFALEGSVAWDGRGLKHPEHDERLLHVDVAAGPWEGEFAKRIYELTRRRPAAVPVKTPKSPRMPAFRATARGLREDAAPFLPPALSPPRPKPNIDELCFSETAFRTFVSENKLVVDDKRSKGGALWVRAEHSTSLIGRRLKAWGFQWSDRKNAWWRNED